MKYLIFTTALLVGTMALGVNACEDEAKKTANPYGDTVLHKAVRNGDLPGVRAMAATNTPYALCLRNALGQTAYELAGIIGDPMRVEMQVVLIGGGAGASGCYETNPR